MLKKFYLFLVHTYSITRIHFVHSVAPKKNHLSLWNMWSTFSRKTVFSTVCYNCRLGAGTRRRWNYKRKIHINLFSHKTKKKIFFDFICSSKFYGKIILRHFAEKASPESKEKKLLYTCKCYIYTLENFSKSFKSLKQLLKFEIVDTFSVIWFSREL